MVDDSAGRKIYTGAMAKRKERLLRRTYTPNQIVALNIARARAMRGWTQEQASAAVAPYLGTRLSNASFSSIERSIAGARVKQFSADELIAFSRGFDLPIGWFFLPPPPEQDAGLHAADATWRGVDMSVLLDAVLGTDSSAPAWRQALLDYAAATANAQADSTGTGAATAGTAENRLDQLAELRAAAELRKAFGNITEARAVLLRLAELIDRLDTDGHQPEIPDTKPATRHRSTRLNNTARASTKEDG